MDAHEIDKQFQIECLLSEMIPMIMDEYDVGMPEAMDMLYTSHTCLLIENENTGLYYQGAVYVFEFLKKELDKPSDLDSQGV